MRRFTLAVILAGVALGLVAAGWWFVDKNAAAPQFAAYRVGRAASFAEAKREIAAIERQPNHDAALRELVAGWRTGNPAFDFYLAAYVSDRQSSDDLRHLFSNELSWRPDLLTDWAHFWSWRAKQSPDVEAASIAEYLDALASTDPPRKLSWREILDLQATFTNTAHQDLAIRISPDNWPQRFQAWRQSAPSVTGIRRPKLPLPDWHGPVLVVPE